MSVTYIYRIRTTDVHVVLADEFLFGVSNIKLNINTGYGV